MTSPFAGRVLTVVRGIPAGRVATYGDVAAFVARPRAARAVGTIMRNCHMPDIPCHRVVGAGGRPGGYSDLHVQRELLRAERIRVIGDRLPDFTRIRWQGGNDALS